MPFLSRFERGQQQTSRIGNSLPYLVDAPAEVGFFSSTSSIELGWSIKLSGSPGVMLESWKVALSSGSYEA